MEDDGIMKISNAHATDTVHWASLSMFETFLVAIQFSIENNFLLSDGKLRTSVEREGQKKVQIYVLKINSIEWIVRRSQRGHFVFVKLLKNFCSATFNCTSFDSR